MKVLLVMICVAVMLGAAGWFGYRIWKNFTKILPEENRNSEEHNKKIRAANKVYKNSILKSTLIGVTIFLVSTVALIMGPCGMYTVNAGEIAVVKTFGKITGTSTSGMHWNNVLTQSVTTYDTKVQYMNIEKWCYVRDVNDKGENITQVVQVIANVQFHINETNVTDIASKYGTMGALKTGITSYVLGTLETEASGYELNNLLTGTGKSAYQANVFNQLKTNQTEYYITFRTAIIEEFVLEPALEEALLKVRLAEAERKAAEQKYEQETSRIKAESEQSVIKAEAEAAAKEASAQGDAAAIKAVADAKAYEIQKIAEAEAEAIRLKLDELTKGDDTKVAEALAYMEYLAWVERWDGKLPETVLGDGINVFFPLS